MAINGTVSLVLAENTKKNRSQSALNSALMNANEEVIKMDVKNGKKAKKTK